MFGLISKKKIINTLAHELARIQVHADNWYYISKNQDMSSYVLTHGDELKEITRLLHIGKEVYAEAKKIYDFSKSGSTGFEPDLKRIKNINDELHFWAENA